MIAADALGGGFADPVFDAQSAFRAVLDALARPGRIVELAPRTAPPAPLSPAAGAIVAALADEGTPVWLDRQLAAEAAVATWITFHTGAPVTEVAEEAAFGLVGDARGIPSFDAFRQGSAEFPDRSTTLVVQLETLDAGTPLSLAGPGIDGTAGLAPGSLPEDFVARMAANRALFPRGVDLILTAVDRITGLPRSTRIAAAGAD